MPLLHYDLIQGPEATPSRWTFILAGIYGAGRNWNGVARSLVRARPDWGVVAVDLRGHGSSAALAPSLPRRPEAILGHSFGGKVALLYGDEPDHGIRSTWVVDSTPDSRPPGGSAWGMLRVLRESPGPFASRDEAFAAVVSHGYPEPVARWMGTNLVSEGDHYRWRLDPDQMEALLRDFFETDAWGTVEGAHGPELHFIQATESSILSPEAVGRIQRAGQSTGRAHLHRVAGGHWLNADNPEEIVRLLAEYLPGDSQGGDRA
ncbi:MAG: alpha/beta hydrolase [Gemmatimonadota bacterium]